jgi:UDP-N-acetylglucosamine 2-epimerase (hydrolysing)
MKKILFITGTRADFGKLKSLIQKVHKNKNYIINIFITGMHTLFKYGYTVDEVLKFCDYIGIDNSPKNICVFHNQDQNDKMDRVLLNTIDGLSKYINENKPDLIVVHGDRVEALAGSLVGMLKNIYVGHIEGGEFSGNIDESIRHSISKQSHFHFVSNAEAEKTLIQLGENKKNIYKIGSPDIDLMLSKKLPSFNRVKKYYNINFDKKKYGIILFHPVTTNGKETLAIVKSIIKSAVALKKNFVIIYPNNDEGKEIIFNQFLKSKIYLKRYIRAIPSMRFEYFLTLLRNSKVIIGNSSAGIREAPVYGVNSVNLGTRQNNRSKNQDIFNLSNNYFKLTSILKNIFSIKEKNNLKKNVLEFGNGNSANNFIRILNSKEFWKTSKQKFFYKTYEK